MTRRSGSDLPDSVVVLLSASPATLAERKAADRARSRRNFRLHARLGPSLRTYYGALGRLRPGTVHPLDAGGDPGPEALALISRLEPAPFPRYDVPGLARLKAELDARLAEADAGPARRRGCPLTPP
jgi:hypothetical protein